MEGGCWRRLKYWTTDWAVYQNVNKYNSVIWFPTLISMADQPSSSAAKRSKKKGGSMKKLFRDLFRPPNSLAATGSDSASQSNSTLVSVSSAFGSHDPVPGKDAGSAGPMVSSKYIASILVLSTTIRPLQMTKLPWIKVYTVLISYFADLADLAHHPDSTAPIQLARPSSSVRNLLGSAVGQGEL